MGCGDPREEAGGRSVAEHQVRSWRPVIYSGVSHMVYMRPGGSIKNCGRQREAMTKGERARPMVDEGNARQP
jgi:hypothetical protein